ncbi:MAG: hypothetical protein KKF89_03265 [Nanoarchaeota archaeon]|nr:hypothetical protein [Nanoarchaeota archaeon]MBU1854715.1 hypothetical protein [Nanoarchaeota archaeon]
MSKPEIIEKTPITIVNLKTELKNIHKRDGELTFRGNKTEEYLNDFVKLSKKDADELTVKLNKLDLARLKPQFITKVVDLMPTTVNELKVILQGYTLSIKTEDMNKIVKVVKEYVK